MKIKILLSGVACAGALTAACFAVGQSLPMKTQLGYWDKIPSRLTMYSSNNQKVRISSLSGDYRVLFYLRSDSADSLQRLIAIRKIMDIYRWDSVRYYLIWEDKIPLDTVMEAGIDTNCNYTLKNDAVLSRYVPTAFIVGKNGTVEFVSGYAYTDILYRIYTLAGKNDLRPTVNQMIFEDARGSNPALDAGKPNLFVFTTSTCQTCVAEEDALNALIKTVDKSMNVITIRPDFDSRQSMDSNLCYDYSYAYFEVYKKSNGIEAMPFYVITDEQFAVVRVFTQLSRLSDYLRTPS